MRFFYTLLATLMIGPGCYLETTGAYADASLLMARSWRTKAKQS